MCLAIPSKVVAIDGIEAVVERYGEQLTISLAMMLEPIAVGDYVTVRARSHAVEKLDEASAKEALRLFDELSEMMGPEWDTPEREIV